MTRFRYAGVIALDPNTEETTIVRSATGTVHTNENWSNPVTVFDINDLPLSQLNTTAEGLFPDFSIEDHPVVGFKTSSGHRFYLVSTTPLPGTPGPAPTGVIMRDGKFVFQYPDGVELVGPDVPAGTPGKDGTSGYPVWIGTQAEYDALPSRSTTTLYAIKAV